MPTSDRRGVAGLEPVVRGLLGGPSPVTIRAWDGTQFGPPDAPATIVVRSPDALRRLLYAPGELGLGRAYVSGDLDIEGDLYAALALLRDAVATRSEAATVDVGWRGRLEVVRAARQAGALGPPLAVPPEESRLRGRVHSRRRDADAISHHYDVSNEFYRIVLGPSMTYSCAVFTDETDSLEQAQANKHELICRKLGAAPGMHMLDVGCGWGSLLIHAAKHHGVKGVGVTISRQQQELAAKRVAEAGLGDKVEIRLQDYRDVVGERFDAISSVGMFEHVGLARLREYFGTLRAVLRPEGRLLNHAISRPPGPAAIDRRSFMGRYVFPDGELHEVGAVVSAMQEEGFEVRDVESLREHYALTLRHWVANLEANWDRAVEAAGSPRARIWRLYMAGSALNFEAARTSIHQVLGMVTSDEGRSGAPLTRADWVLPPG